MAVLPMKKMQLVAMKRDQKSVLEFLQRRHIVEVSTSDQVNEVFSTINCDEECDLAAQNQATAQNAVAVLERYANEKTSFLSFLEGREIKTTQEYYDFEKKVPWLLKEADRLGGLEEEKVEAEKDILRFTALQEELVPWLSLPVALNYKGTKSTNAFIGSLVGVYTHSDILLNLAQLAPNLSDYHVDVLSTRKEQTCILLHCLPAQAEEMKSALDKMDFNYPKQSFSVTPKEKSQEYTLLKQQAHEGTKRLEQEILAHLDQQKDLYFLTDYYAMNFDTHKAMGKMLESNHTFLLEGYIVEEATQKLNTDLSAKYDCIVTFRETEESGAPVALRNNRFSEPVENVVGSYGYPSGGEIDPTSVMSIFYYIMFGLMFSDAGYGLILATACGLLLTKYKNMEENTQRSLRMFFWCGLSTVFWGIIFSSYFGDAIDVISETFFGHKIAIPPVWFSPLDNPMLLLMFCLAIGLVHLSLGYVINGLNSARAGDKASVIVSAGFPLLFIYSIVPVFMSTDIFKTLGGFTIHLSPLINTILLTLSGLSCLGVILFAGRESKNIFIRLLKGLYELYNMLAGWLSDLLSYSRLLALGLATGIIGTILNTLGALGGRSILGVILFILVFVFGHALNFGINILGSYVHSNRLEFVEFFGKFYSGESRKFSPLGINTKHYNIKEDTTNG